MYKIYADGELIYDSTIDDYKINKGAISLETNKSGSFVFSIYPDHFYYDKFVHLKTVIVVKRSGKIIFRGRVLNDVTDYFNNKVITCEGELGFLQDSIVRPFNFNGTASALFDKLVSDHNAQVDDFKKFKIGSITVEGSIETKIDDYDTSISILNSKLTEGDLGGYFYITHGADGTEEIPTLNYLADFTNISSQAVEFGSNLKDYTKTISSDSIATAIIPLGKADDNGNKLTIKSVNGDKDYLVDTVAKNTYGLIFKTVEYSDIEVASELLTKGRQALVDIVNKNITIELTAVDLHLLDRSIESFNVGDYIHVISKPHNFNSTLLCNKQDIDLLKPDNDKLTLGYTYSTFTEANNKSIKTSVIKVSDKVTKVEENTTAEITTINTDIADLIKRVEALEKK